MTRIDIDLLRYGSRGAVYRVTYDSRMLVAESRVPASDAARARLGGNFPERGHANDRRVVHDVLLQVTLRLRRCDARQQKRGRFESDLQP